LIERGDKLRHRWAKKATLEIAKQNLAESGREVAEGDTFDESSRTGEAEAPPGNDRATNEYDTSFESMMALV